MSSLRSGLASLRYGLAWLPDPVVALIIIAFALVVAFALHRSVRHLIRRLLAERYPFIFSIFTQMRGVTRLAIVIIALVIAVPVAPISLATARWFATLLLILVIGFVGWTAMTGLHIAADIYLHRFAQDTEENFLARKHLTQVQVLLRAGDVMIIILTFASALMTFEPVRQYGYSLFASAGVAGIVAGLAARPVLSNIFAGVQLAMTQPIRINDTVIVENEWGIIEEITATYVVVRIWDLRRLIVPLSYFIEKPFQNWTRDSTALLGVVNFYLDYRAPIDAMRDKLSDIVNNSRSWNGKTVGLQVTDSRETTIEVRALMSANSAGQAWDLRCEVREKMISFLQQEHPEALPRRRTDMEIASHDAAPLAPGNGQAVTAASHPR
ncbi:MAG TPA: mechanosensitive ion channel domain-containing protein [Pseudolabrys sp.]|jgi:small-conductance mechanosensitive channel|nr:mechanosensitive ion channel domain-containing protein [Pseudolabrys sp.]